MGARYHKRALATEMLRLIEESELKAEQTGNPKDILSMKQAKLAAHENLTSAHAAAVIEKQNAVAAAEPAPEPAPEPASAPEPEPTGEPDGEEE